jgi:hypothetical protein
MSMLRDDTQRQYRIDIETNSTVDVEATEDQKQMSEVLTAISQFMQGVSPLVMSGSMPFEVAQSMLLAIVRRYRMGSEIEDYIKQMKQPTPPDAGQAAGRTAKQQAFESQDAGRDSRRASASTGMTKADQAKITGEKEIAAIERRDSAWRSCGYKREELRKAAYNKLMAPGTDECQRTG